MKLAKRFFKQVLGNILETQNVDIEFRCLHPSQDTESLRPIQFWCQSIGEIENRWPEMKDLNRRGYDIHYTVVPRLREIRGKKEHPLPDEPVFNCLWADLDVGEDKPFKRLSDALKQIEIMGPKPTILVESGVGLHPYYVFDRPRRISRARAEALLQALAGRLHGDPRAARSTRLMRVPNTRNWKDFEDQRVCRVWFNRKRRYSPRDLEDLLTPTTTRHKSADPRAKAQVDFFDLFNPHVKRLTRNGEWVRGLCPFHDDQNPSFAVNVRSGRWVCFACGIDGNWTDFKRRMEITDESLNPTEKHSYKGYEWKKLPRFNPAHAPETKWIVEGIVPERGITILVGAPGAFKSTFALMMADAVSKGEEFLGRETLKRRVLYLDNENPPDVLKARNENMKLEMEANKKLRLWSMYDDRPVPKILDKKLRLIVKKSVEDGKKPLIILDHWSSFLRPGEGGETTGQISPLLQELKHLCALGATIVLLHHTRKYEKDIEYGGADLRAKCDAIHTLVLHQDPIDPNKKVIRGECFLKRHGGNSSFAIRPHVVDGQVVGFESVKDPRLEERSKKRALLRELIRKNPGMVQHQLVRRARELGLSRDEIREILNNGIGKHWKIKISAHGANTYNLLED
jgi:hypothetical protein